MRQKTHDVSGERRVDEREGVLVYSNTQCGRLHMPLNSVKFLRSSIVVESRSWRCIAVQDSAALSM